MKKFLTSFFTFFLFIISCFILTSPSRAAVTPDTSEIRDGIRFSECVRPYNGGVLIANYGSQHKMPGIDEIKGYILYRKNGQTKTLIPPGLLHYPSGMAVKDDYLFVCDGDHLRVYNLQQPEKGPQTITFPKPYWLKAAAIDGNTLYVSSDNVGQILSSRA